MFPNGFQATLEEPVRHLIYRRSKARYGVALGFSWRYLWDRVPNSSQQRVTTGQVSSKVLSQKGEHRPCDEVNSFGGRGVQAGSVTMPGPRRSSAQLMPRHPDPQVLPDLADDRTSEGQVPASCKHNGVILFSSWTGAKFNKKELNEELILTSQCASKNRSAGKGFINSTFSKKCFVKTTLEQNWK